MKNLVKGFSKLPSGVNKLVYAGAKNAPLILSVAGGIGLGATAYLAYKSAKQVEEITDDLEAAREKEEVYNDLKDKAQQYKDLDVDVPEDIEEALKEFGEDYKGVDRMEYGKRLVGAVAKPAVVGTLSICAIALSYYIQNKRIATLTAAVATAAVERTYFDNKYREKHGEEAFQEFKAATHEETVVEENDKGKEVEVKHKVKDVEHTLDGVWFSNSSEFTIDDHDYNETFIHSVAEKADFILFRDGFLSMNALFGELGLPRTKGGALMGWSTSTGLNISTKDAIVYDNKRKKRIRDIHITWTAPRYIYDDVNYNLYNKNI